VSLPSKWVALYICAKGVNFAFVSTILDWIVVLYRQCGIFSLYYSIYLFLSSSYSDFYCSLMFLLRCFAALHMLSIRYPLLIYYASVYRGPVRMNVFFSLFQFKLVLLFISTTKMCHIFQIFSPLEASSYTFSYSVFSLNPWSCASVCRTVDSAKKMNIKKINI
jgi:hypothetical protein